MPARVSLAMRVRMRVQAAALALPGLGPRWIQRAREAAMDAGERLGSLRRMLHMSFWRSLSPSALLVLSFAALIAAGTAGLLLLPGLYTGARLGVLDALFTATSAVCVTGLAVVDTATYFTFWGQLWILILIQLGGLGVITLSTVVIGALGRRLSLRTEMLAVCTPQRDGRQVWELTLTVARFTLVLEGTGTLLLFLLWLPRFPVQEAFWHALFQAVSAFCNAGFATFSNSVMGFQQSPLTLLILSVLIICGGIGFLTFNELSRWWHARRQRRLSSHTYVVLVTTGALLVIGTAGYACFEWNEALGDMELTDKLANAWFMSVTPRTAGFNSISYSALGNDAVFFTVMLMIVGGSPGSTAGGLKTTTLAVLVALAWARFRGRGFVEINRRGLPKGTIERTVSMTLLAVAILTLAFLILDAVESAGLSPQQARGNFLPIVFEAVSAFGTVGLSMDMTPTLAPVSRLVIILLMFIGRVGLLSFFAAISLQAARARAIGSMRPAQEDIVIG